MTEEWARLLSEHWPTLSIALVGLIGVYYVIKTLALTFDAVSEALGPLGKIWRARRSISQAEADDMRRRLQYLAEQVRALRHRDECYFAYCLMDAEWHRRQELLAINHGWNLEPHTSFLDFSDKWMRDRGLEKELDIWM